MHLVNLLSLLPIALAIPLKPRTAAPFEGQGQLIVTGQNHIDYGCLIATGEMTANFSNCATFTGVRDHTPGPEGWEDYGTTWYYLNSSIGYCGTPFTDIYPGIGPLTCSPTMHKLSNSYFDIADGFYDNVGTAVLVYKLVGYTLDFQTLDAALPSGDGLKQLEPSYRGRNHGGWQFAITWRAL
ncbi:hypothetical protein P154DRAFT_538252 [Amniculicola lignicola CBS 123094]|uniref:Ecp2 effector protein domain-containing protein n=1 Tax=Amniculicola lignicola CBS 123094 TaxID=1392246 RepID=A0A6A5W2U4_9PLEO|nr:hypothetical protein P154DRAFT_538252 [Amniculicola lignicola CBS 123094]